MISVHAVMLAVAVSSASPSSTCAEWKVGKMDHTYQGSPASRDCTCLKAGNGAANYYGPACDECRSFEGTLFDGGVTLVSGCLKTNTTGCSTSPGLFPLLGLALLLLKRRE